LVNLCRGASGHSLVGSLQASAGHLVCCNAGTGSCRRTILVDNTSWLGDAVFRQELYCDKIYIATLNGIDRLLEVFPFFFVCRLFADFWCARHFCPNGSPSINDVKRFRAMSNSFRWRNKSSHEIKKPLINQGFGIAGGDGGSRTHDTGLSPYASLAGKCLRPLGHVSTYSERHSNTLQ
jgi:hypothetical protein